MNEKSTLYYYEYLTVTGKWEPATETSKPETTSVNGHLHRKQASGSVGPRIRNVVTVNLSEAEKQEFMVGKSLLMEFFNLSKLQEKYGTKD
jgi:hypothetical protein